MKIDSSKAGTKLPRIIRAALSLFVEKGVEATTTKDIAKKAGVAEGAFYRHYPSKSALAEAIYRDNLEELTALLFMALSPDATLRVNLGNLIRTLFEKYEEEPQLARFVLFAQFRETPNLPADFRFPSDAFRRALEIAAKRGEVKRREIALLTPIVFGAAVRVTVFRSYGDFDDLRPLAGDVAEYCARLAS